MDSLTAQEVTLHNGERTHFYEGGATDGTPLIFIHGWPDIAETWKHQLSHFSTGTKYRVIAPDMRGYGDSSAPNEKECYSLEVLVSELVEFAGKLGIGKAVWIGHDWGCGIVNALAAHHPELFIGLALMSVPYRSIELGLDHVKSTTNRDIYPEDEYPLGQWDYMRYYELNPEDCTKSFESHIANITKAMYLRHDPREWGKPSPASRITKTGGWFGGHPEAVPDVPLAYTFLDESLLANLIKSHERHGFSPATAYYLNHASNEEYSKKEKNGGVLEFPVLYVDAKHDSICSPSTTPKLAENQKNAIENLTYVTIESGHWVHLEKSEEVNEALEQWLQV
jgi:soluble epoxide hydrolase/lipid-phosphate phosphatase